MTACAPSVDGSGDAGQMLGCCCQPGSQPWKQGEIEQVRIRQPPWKVPRIFVSSVAHKITLPGWVPRYLRW